VELGESSTQPINMHFALLSVAHISYDGLTGL